MFTFQPNDEIYNTPPRLKAREYDDIFENKISSDCVSFGGNSGGKFIFQVNTFKEEEYNMKDPAFESKLIQEVDDKTKGIKSILGRLGTTIDRLKGEVGCLINPQFSFIQNQLLSKAQSKIIINGVESEKENQSHITTTVFQPLNVQLGTKPIDRSCTKSCSKIKSQMKRYANNQQFKSYQNMLKEITFSESNKKNSIELQSIKGLGQPKINARRKLDFDFSMEDNSNLTKDCEYFGISTPKCPIQFPINDLDDEEMSDQNKYSEEDKQSICENEGNEDNTQFDEPKNKKIFVKDINRGGNNNEVNYFYIYRTQH